MSEPFIFTYKSYLLFDDQGNLHLCRIGGEECVAFFTSKDELELYYRAALDTDTTTKVIPAQEIDTPEWLMATMQKLEAKCKPLGITKIAIDPMPGRTVRKMTFQQAIIFAAR